MVIEKQTVHRLYTSDSADFIDTEGDVRPIADFDGRTMEFADESFPPLFAEATSVTALKRVVQNTRPKRRGPSRRGGRAYNEGSDSELDPFWNVPVEPLSDEQRATNAHGIQAVRDALAKAREQKDDQ